MVNDPLRKDAILRKLSQTSLRALACFSPAEVLLLTGYWPVMGCSVAIFTREGQLCAIVPEDELDLAKATSDAEFIPYKPASLEYLTDPVHALIEPLEKLLTRLQLNSGVIGASLSDGMQPASYLSGTRFRSSATSLLQQVSHGVFVEAADAMLDQLRSVKTPVELDQIRRASRLAAAGFEEAAGAIKAGRREDEVAAEIEAAFSKVALQGFERSRGHFFCMSGPNSYQASGAYARTRRRVIQAGDLVMIHANTAGDGYWTDITRTYVAGQPSAEQRRMQDAIAAAREAAFSRIAPGAPAKAVDAAARDMLSSRGYGPAFKHSTGHGVGFAAADPNALPRIHPKSPDVLEPGMTFNIEPAIYVEEIGGMRHCDMVACTPSGFELLTEF